MIPILTMEETLERFVKIFNEDVRFSALILMGSYGCDSKLAKIGSDLDLLCLTDLGSVDASERLCKIIQTEWSSEILLSIQQNSKIVVYIKTNIPSSDLNSGFMKLDVSFANCIDEQARYLRGSEGCKILVNKNAPSLEADIKNLMSVKAYQVLPEYESSWHINRFLEMFELLCKNAAQKDAYRADFHGNLIRHDLVVIERITFGERQHLYLPKRAFDDGVIQDLKVFSFKDVDDETFWQIITEYKIAFIKLCQGLNVDKNSLKSYQEFLDYVFQFYKSTYNRPR